MNESPLEVILFCPTGQDSTLVANVLSAEHVDSIKVNSIQELCERNQQDAGALIIADEALTAESLDVLNRALQTQEPWSDIPILLLTSGGPRKRFFKLERLEVFVSSGNVTLLERPFQQSTLVSAVKVALRARRRQYQVRSLLISQTEATKIRDEFISMASHELKTPLTALKLQAQIILKLNDDPNHIPKEKLGKLFKSTMNQIDRLNKLIDDMLDISRVTTGKLQIQKEHTNLSLLMEELIERFSPQFELAKIDVKKNISPDVSGFWDGYKIEQVINNLLANAIRYSPGKPIFISLEKDAENAILIVHDSGPGIEPDHHERIFERFERASTTISGLGLGLYIAREIVELHDGHITVESKHGHGAKFVIKIPFKA